MYPDSIMWEKLPRQISKGGCKDAGNSEETYESTEDSQGWKCEKANRMKKSYFIRLTRICFGLERWLEAKLSCERLDAIYIARWDVLYFSNMSVVESWERTVHCLFCNSMATLKPTKTRRIMLRCNTCGALVFANWLFSQQRIRTLRDFRFTPVRDLV